MDTNFERYKYKKQMQLSSDMESLNAEYNKLVSQLGERYVEFNYDKDGDFFAADVVKDIREMDERIALLNQQQYAFYGIRLCEECGAELSIDSSFCNKCGANQSELRKEVIYASGKCPKCGSPIKAGDGFCMACGKKFD